MTPRDLVLAVIDRCAGKGEFGCTSLQKVIYLIAVKLRLDLGHTAYFFGPFSPTVEAHTNALALSGLIEESVRILGTNAEGWPVRQYTYHTTEEGKDAVKEIAADEPGALDQINELIDQIEEAVGSLDQKVLSAAAKVLYIAREEERPVQFDEIGKLALEHGWKLALPQVDRVAQMLDRLELARVVKGA